MRVGVGQVRSGEDVDGNLGAVETVIRDAASRGAELVAIPEYAGYLGRSSSAVVAPLGDGRLERLCVDLARDLGVWIVGGTVAEREGEAVFDTTPVIAPDGEIVARYRKIHLFDVELPGQPPFRESATFMPGHELVTHETPGGRVGLAICYDLRFPELFRGLMALGAETIVVPSQFQHVTGQAHWHVLVRARAVENQCFVVAPAQWGAYGDPQDGRRSYGHSLVVGPWGDVLAEAPEEGDVAVVVDLDPSELRRVRRALPALQHRRLGLVC
ncbi:MAG TPA: carbon-nitrogen hydrolase family protein [Actinomycetota bacterium]|nr:carbon-nitrogen hydrolase family protein [Actinomycetota bacterium]